MKTRNPTTETTSLAASVAPEDLRRGDYVAVLTEVIELPSFLWFDLTEEKREEPVRMRLIPSGSGLPWKVHSICLPFVLVRSPSGVSDMFDVRRMHLARLTKDYAKSVRRELRRQASRSARQRAPA